MNKKSNFIKKLKFLLFVLILPCALFFCACGQTTINAYDIAVKNGFNGTEQEWIESLNGNNGQNGKSAYDIAVENGFNGTEQEWLESLNGNNGQNGKDAVFEDSYDMYLNAVEHENYIGSYLDFIKDNFTVTADNSVAVANKCISSVVEVQAYNVESSKQSGSGVIYNLDAYGNAFIVTNYHVVINNRNAVLSHFKLSLYGQTETFPATYVGGSSKYDIAILYVEANDVLLNSNVQPATINTDDVKLGTTCYSIGNVNGEGIALGKGVVNVDSEEKYATVGGTRLLHRFIRHDCPISHGSSGGGLFNSNGELIGITNGGKTSTESAQNFAIPSSIVYAVAEGIIKNCFNTQSTIFEEYEFGISFKSDSVSWVYNNLTGMIDFVEDVKITGISSDIQTTLQVGDKIISATLTKENEQVYTKNIDRIFNLQDLLLLAESGDSILITTENGSDIIAL